MKPFLPEKFKSDFHKRLWSVIEEKGVSYWAKQIGVKPTAIRDGWLYQGDKKPQSFPSVDSIIKLCQVGKISADWLLCGRGGKHLTPEQTDQRGENTVELQDKLQSAQNTIERLTKQNEKLTDIILNLSSQGYQSPFDKEQSGTI